MKLPIQISDEALCCPRCAGAALNIVSVGAVFIDPDNPSRLNRADACSHKVLAAALEFENAEDYSTPSAQVTFRCGDCEAMPVICLHFDSSVDKTIVHWAADDASAVLSDDTGGPQGVHGYDKDLN